MTPKKQNETRITLRLPKGLSEWVSSCAKEKGISQNAQINITLYEKMAAESSLPNTSSAADFQSIQTKEN